MSDIFFLICSVFFVRRYCTCYLRQVFNISFACWSRMWVLVDFLLQSYLINWCSTSPHGFICRRIPISSCQGWNVLRFLWNSIWNFNRIENFFCDTAYLGKLSYLCVLFLLVESQKLWGYGAFHLKKFWKVQSTAISRHFNWSVYTPGCN